MTSGKAFTIPKLKLPAHGRVDYISLAELEHPCCRVCYRPIVRGDLCPKHLLREARR